MSDETYLVRRFRKDEDISKGHHEVIDTGLTREEAKEHCEDNSESGVWFDGFERE